ncbi:hypothetical protein [uncultured Phenylobacterium sp.]|uniref:hypothetical protein n=1 Tax=uncultured Phenylobacterium sp. TaxID=349273 RepID=UPI0025CE6C8E|nr:hypothetical protein [uncultured Phenylobacterium sp.]
MRAMVTWFSLGVLALALGACEPKAPARSAAPPAPPVASIAPVALPTAAAAVAPETVAMVSQALAMAQAFSTRAAEDLAAAAKAEARFPELAAQASEAASRAGATPDRPALVRRVELARTEAEAARADLAARAAAFRAGAQAQTDAVAQAQLQCVQTPEFAASEPCVKLMAEQATLAQTVTTLTTRFAAAEAAYQKQRPRFDEASATMLLGGR